MKTVVKKSLPKKRLKGRKGDRFKKALTSSTHYSEENRTALIGLAIMR